MFNKESIPFAPALIESMRSLGYSFEAAIADLIDNSISANAKNIRIKLMPSDNPKLIIFDDGCGMDEYEIEEAMRYGSKNPLEKRKENDLGRFGLGLKSASLSQCRKLLVVSKKNEKISAYCWDLDHISKEGSWMLIGYEQDEIKNLPYIELLDEVESGTYLILEKFDRVEESTNDLQETMKENLVDTIEHLSLVFHRYLSSGVNIFVNNQEIEPKDPFLKNNKKTQPLRESKIRIDGQIIKVKPYILPHIKYLSNNDLKKVGGVEKLKSEQGFYVYRNKRLIIWGTWFRLARKNELSKLARVQVDISNSLDYMWSIDIKKSSANLPNKLKKKLYSAIEESTIKSERVYTYRGRKEKSSDDINYVWERIKTRDGYDYKINREIPQLKLLEETLDGNKLKLLDSLLSNLEETFPTSTFYLDASNGKVNDDIESNSDELFFEVKEQIDFARKNGLDYKKILNAFIKSEPYCRDSNLVERLKKLNKRV
ncbi:ATP-binding protein [Clostridium perfringens]